MKVQKYRVDQIYEAVGIGKRQVSNYSEGPKPELSTGEVRVSSLSSTWMEPEHEEDVKTELWRCGGEQRLSRS
jgi:hypothetical protein